MFIHGQTGRPAARTEEFDVSRSTLAQGHEVLGRLRDHNDTEVQRLIDNWDLAEMIMSHGADKVDRLAFRELLLGRLTLPDPLDPFNLLLCDLDEQMSRLREYNAKYWDNRIPDEWFRSVFTESDLKCPQRVDDLTILHVEFGSLEETADMWWRAIAGEQPKSLRWSEMKFDERHLQLLDSNVDRYEPGIHVVRINLLAHWEPEKGCTFEEAREQAQAEGETLAQLEVMSAYGLHRGLLRAQDGQTLPYADMVGTNLVVPHRLSKPYPLILHWDRHSCFAHLSASYVGGATECAAPVLVKAERTKS